MSVAAIVCRGFGPAASIPFVVTRGFSPSSAPIIIPSDTHDGILDEKTYRKYQERLRKQAKREFEQEKAKSAKRRKDLLNLYRGIEETALVAPKAQSEVKAPEPVKLQPKPENLDRIAVQLSAILEQLNRAQQRVIREYLAEMERQDEEEIEMLLMEVL